MANLSAAHRLETIVPLASEISREERAILDAIRATAYGAVEVVVHQSRVVQIVRTERVRFDANGREP